MAFHIRSVCVGSPRSFAQQQHTVIQSTTQSGDVDPAEFHENTT